MPKAKRKTKGTIAGNHIQVYVTDATMRHLKTEMRKNASLYLSDTARKLLVERLAQLGHQDELPLK